MLKRLREALGWGAEVERAASTPEAPPESVAVVGSTFPLARHLHRSEGLPHADWSAVQAWVDTLQEPATRDAAWALCEAAWLAHLGFALGPQYRLRAAGLTLLLSSLEARPAQVVLDYVALTRSRVLRVLEGVAQDEGAGHDIVVLFDDEDSYYRYVSHHYPASGEFAFSGGMCIHDGGCVHFVARRHEQHALEPVIAHETTHAMLAHLPLPLWLNEGLAVNTERRLSPPPVGPRHTDVSAQQMHRRHQAFWGRDEIQQFWSGESFGRTDQGNELSYDLARILVEQFAADWPRFARFANAAHRDDAGDAAARECLGAGLGVAVAALLEIDDATACVPQPAAWDQVRIDPARAA